MTATPMSPAELLAKLRELHWVDFGMDPTHKLDEDQAASLLTTWRDAHGRAERERAIRDAHAACTKRLRADDYAKPVDLLDDILALQERPNE